MRAVALATFLYRLAASVRSRTEAKGLSTTLVVRRCCHRSGTGRAEADLGSIPACAGEPLAAKILILIAL